MKIDFKYLPIVLIILANVVVFTNSLHGDFVYDDTRQIVRNPLIQDTALYGKALISDVWAFKGDGTIAVSNYWRPTFTIFNILAFQTFALSPVGWHLLNILLHIGVCVLAFLLLYRWGLSAVVAFAIALIFSVHPVHVESVAWIAGSPDLLFSIFLLASIWFAGNYARRKSIFELMLAILFYAFAVGSKEVAVLCFPIFWFVYLNEQNLSTHSNSRKGAIRFVVPFAVVAVLFFLLRWEILGQISHPIDGAITSREALLTIPLTFIFYLKQILLPFSLGINYSLRPVASLDLFRFVLPSIISIAVLVLFFLIAKHSYIQKLGCLLFFLPLLPVMNLTAFMPEQFVHDRYLYLPLLGFLMMFVPYLHEFISLRERKNTDKIVVALAILLSIPLGVKTFFQNRVWLNDIALWEHSTKIDPNSSHNWSQYGAALLEKGVFEKSVEAYDHSLEIKVSPLALMGRARGNLNLKRLEEAVWDLKTVTEMNNEESNAYTLYQTYEALAIAYSAQGKLDDAANILIESRKRLPIYHAALTEKLAIVYYQAGKKDLALAELENAKAQARAEMLPESKAVFLRLGILYAELGQNEKSRAVLQEYLKLTSSLQDKLSVANRKTAIELLNKGN